MNHAYIAMGSNLDEPHRTRLDFLRAATRELGASAGLEVCAVSSVYESPALQAPADKSGPDNLRPSEEPQPPYLNAVVHVRTSLSPDALLERCLDIERRHGRVRSAGRRWESRTLDLDIVYMEGVHLASEDLTVPHPGLAERRFVLEPLAEIAPGLLIGPPLDASVEYLLSVCPDEAIPTRLRLDEPL
ncbi:MAG: 2-amino-4-hydroxy-6-hydroxymethyldihydropteridine diphosphokinase [Rhodothermales bacterium]